MRQQTFHLTVPTYANDVIETFFPPLQAKKNPASEAPHSISQVFVKQQRTMIRNQLIIYEKWRHYWFCLFNRLFPSAATTDTLWRKEETPHYYHNSSLDSQNSISELLTALSPELNVRNSASALHHEKVHTYFHSRVVIYFKTRIYCVIV